MFAKTLVKLAAAGRSVGRRMPPFGLFMKENAGSKALAGKPGAARGKAMGKMWRALSEQERQAYFRRSKTMVCTPKVKAPKKPRVAGSFAKFVKANYSKVHRLPFNQRLAALAKLYRA
jgi:hypothetical protein